jgi:hypothetical protein
MKAHLITVIAVPAKLHEVFFGQDCSTLPKNLGRAVPLEAMVPDESVPDALLLDVAASLGD